ncbi:hypothetical protein [Bradyrhizobium uaiense]|uniref:Uncharacterized protein n=1 Tax=Bradyrhizobium uaiense TaxID=2594946 RepID=A0A6P1BUK2_9BRAD|nr:hypothetical protein [Bradyrhizobium uaiense]NEV01850.1 hypothetical protein [Bradyrhizobium uaiense]
MNSFGSIAIASMAKKTRSAANAVIHVLGLNDIAILAGFEARSAAGRPHQLRERLLIDLDAH